MEDKLKRTMRVGINTKLYQSIIRCIEKRSPWALEGKLYKVIDASRIEHTDNVRFELEAIDVQAYQ